jgi:hypothetical protein
MTDEQIERLAELVFQKLLAKQNEWDEKFNRDIYTEIEIPDSVHIATQLAVSEMLLKQYVEAEEYYMAGEIQKTIELLNNKLKQNE